MLRRLPLLLLALPGAGLAQEIVVTGRGLAPAPGEEAFDVIVLDRDRLTGSASNRLEEILRDVPGFQLFRRSDSRSANPTSQGATLRALGGNASSRALLILDGVPQSDPFGGWISWPAFDPRRLGEVRVTRGGGSGVNGPGALAGTIELSSALASDLQGTSGSLAYGSRDSVDAFASVGASPGGGFVSASAAFARGDGFVPVVREQRGPVDRPAPYRQASLSARALAPLASGVELQASALAFRDERERGTALTAISTRGADASVRLVAARWLALAYVQIRDFYNSFASANTERTATTRTAEQYSVPATGIGGRVEWRPRLGRAVEFRLGADGRETRGESRELFSFVAAEPTRARAAGGRSRTLGGFAEATFTDGPITVTGGGRLDRWTIAGGFLKERLIATSAVLTDQPFADRSGWEPTGRAGLAWRSGDVTLRAAAYAGWRLPTLNELYRPFRVGADATAANAAMAPERLRGIEAGLEWRPVTAGRIAATGFFNRLEGAIANVTLARGPGTFPGVGFVSAAGEYRQRRNLDAVRASGVELDASLDLGAFSLSGGWSWVDAEVEASGPALPLDGLRPAQTPRHTGSATVAWRDGARRAFLAARYVGRQFEDDLNTEPLPAALTIDAAAVWPLAPRLALELRGENLTGKRVVAGVSSDGIVERATPRTLRIGLRFGGQ